jgi:hypothetical protein
MSYLHYLCCVFVLFVFVLCTLLFPVSLDCQFLIAISILILPKEYISSHNMTTQKTDVTSKCMLLFYFSFFLPSSSPSVLMI